MMKDFVPRQHISPSVEITRRSGMFVILFRNNNSNRIRTVSENKR